MIEKQTMVFVGRNKRGDFGTTVFMQLNTTNGEILNFLTLELTKKSNNFKQ